MVLAIAYGVAILAFGAWTLVHVGRLYGRVEDLEHEVQALKNRRRPGVELTRDTRPPGVPRHRGDGYWGEG